MAAMAGMAGMADRDVLSGLAGLAELCWAGLGLHDWLVSLVLLEVDNDAVPTRWEYVEGKHVKSKDFMAGDAMRGQVWAVAPTS